MVGRGGKSRKVVWFDFPFFYDAVNVVFVAVKCFNAQKRGVKIFQGICRKLWKKEYR